MTQQHREQNLALDFAMDVGGEDKSDLQIDQLVEEDDSMDDLIRDRFRLTAISIAESEG